MNQIPDAPRMAIREAMDRTLVLGLAALIGASCGSALFARPQTPVAKRAPRTLVFAVPDPSSTGRPVTLAECQVALGPTSPISALAFSPDGKTLAVGGYREVLLWDLQTAKLAKRIGAGQLDGPIHAVAFLDGGQHLAVGDGLPYTSGAVKIFQSATGAWSSTFEQPQRVVQCLAVSPDQQFVVAGSADSQIYVWHVASQQLVKKLEAHTAEVLGVAFSADGQRMATASADRTLRVWDPTAWEEILRYDLPATVHAAALSPDGKLVLAAVGGPEEWGLRIGRIESDIQQAARRPPRARAVSTGAGMPLDILWPDRSFRVLVPCHDHVLRMYQAGNGKLTGAFKGHTDWVYSVAASSDGKRWASGCADGTVKLWNAADGRPLATLVQLAARTDQWLIITPRGHFAASSSDALTWTPVGGSETPQQLVTRYGDTAKVAQALQSRPAAGRGAKRKGPRPSQANRKSKTPIPQRIPSTKSQ